MREYEKRILRNLIYKPETFSKFIRTQPNPKYTQKLIHSFLPYRTGIEIEGVKFDKSSELKVRRECQMYDIEDRIIEFERGVNELTFSFDGYKGLYVMNDFFNQYSSNINLNYGMHIHIDGTKLKPFNPSIFPVELLNFLWDLFKYNGVYNRKEVSYDKTAIRFHQDYNSIEYRILSAPKNYAELCKSILVLQYCNHCLIKQKPIHYQHISELVEL